MGSAGLEYFAVGRGNRRPARGFGIAVAAPSSLRPGRPIDGPQDSPPRGWKEIVIATWKDAGEDNLSLVAAGVAFYAFLALFPLLTAFVLSYGLIAEPSAVVRHMQTLTSVMPHDAAAIIGDQLKAMTETSDAKTGFALLIAIGIALYGASKGAGSIMTALNIAYEVGESRGLVKRTAMALAMTAGAVLVIFLAILAISALNFLEQLVPELGGIGQFLLKAAFFLVAGAAVILLLALVYRYGPNRPEAEWRWITPGSAMATLAWLAATLGFGAYVANFSDYNATYGSLGAVIVFLTWLYLSAYIVLLGAELNAIIEIKVGRDTVRDEEARQPGSPAPAGRTEQRDRPSLAERAGEPTKKRDSPSFPALVARLGLFSGLLALLGRSRRTRLRR
jgi:membrane protein